MDNTDKLKKIDNFHKSIKIIQAVLCSAYVIFMSAQVLLIYFAGAEAKATNSRASIFTREIAVDAVLKGLPLLIAAIVVTIIAVVMGVKTSKERLQDIETDKEFIIKSVSKRFGIDNEKNGNKVRIIGLAVIIGAVVLVIIGICNGSAKAVLSKAITICTECIGLG